MSDSGDGTAETKGELRERVAAVLDQIRPNLQADGGDLELIDVDEAGVVTVQLQGACHGCPSASITLAMGVERYLKEQVPEVKRVVSA
ncbi:MAG: NifU family protein [Planctomycetes bacterium]|nr:NifU family protein [Planctomycetota bacterium]